MKHFSSAIDWNQQCVMLQTRKVVEINSCDQRQKNEFRTHHWGLHDYLFRNDGILCPHVWDLLVQHYLPSKII